MVQVKTIEDNRLATVGLSACRDSGALGQGSQTCESGRKRGACQQKQARSIQVVLLLSAPDQITDGSGFRYRFFENVAESLEATAFRL